MRGSVSTAVLATITAVAAVVAPAQAAPAASSTTAVADTAGRWVQLPSGDAVLVRPDDSVQVPPSGAGWAGDQVVRLGAETVVLPVTALPQIGRTIDPAAFDVTSPDPARPAGVRAVLATGSPGALPTVRLTVRVLDAHGAPAQSGTVVLGNTDDVSRFAGLLMINGTDQQVTVPVGHYSAAALVTGADGTRVVSRSDLEVQPHAPVLVLDARDATVRPSFTAPQPSRLDQTGAVWARMDAQGHGFGVSTTGSAVQVAPAPAPSTGTLRWSTTWSRSGQRSAGRPYTYDAMFTDPDVPRAQQHQPAAGAFADVETRYWSSAGKPGTLLIGRLPFAPGQNSAIGMLTPLQAPLVRDEHVLAPPHGFWDTSLLQVEGNRPVVEWLTNPVPTYRPGQRAVVEWLRPAALATVLDAPLFGLPCAACRQQDRLTIEVASLSDSTRGHIGLPIPPSSGPPANRLRLYRGTTLIGHTSGAVSVSADVPAGQGLYRLVVDTDLRAEGHTSLSATSSHSEISFRSARDAGASCGAHARACHVLPLLQVRAALPVDMLGQLPIGGATAILTVTHVPGAAPATLDGATVSVRSGTAGWSRVPVAVQAGGSVRASLPGTRASAGQWVDLQITARDSLGGTIEQTLTRAYRIATG